MTDHNHRSSISHWQLNRILLVTVGDHLELTLFPIGGGAVVMDMLFQQLAAILVYQSHYNKNSSVLGYNTSNACCNLVTAVAYYEGSGTGL